METGSSKTKLTQIMQRLCTFCPAKELDSQIGGERDKQRKQRGLVTMTIGPKMEWLLDSSG